MLSTPPSILGLLLLIEAGVLVARGKRPFAWVFRFLPPLFWIYFLPTAVSAAGIIPRTSSLYPAVINNVLPASLALLFLSVDIGEVRRVGPLALGTMAVSTTGIFVGGPLVQLVFGRRLPAEAWAGLGALAASWMGGSANMIAVKASIGTPDTVFSQVVLVDVVAAYLWLALLMSLTGHQNRFDRFVRARTIRDVRLKLPSEGGWGVLPVLPVLVMVTLAVACSVASRAVGQLFPEIPGVATAYTWTVLVVTALGIGLSFTPAKRLAEQGAPTLGHLLLLLVLACIGAQADLGGLAHAPLFVIAGVCWLVFHGATLLVAGRILRVPLSLLATASQANVGGPVSAPIVAEAFRPGLGGVGLLLAVTGNLAGTYLGIACGLQCKWLSARL